MPRVPARPPNLPVAKSVCAPTPNASRAAAELPAPRESQTPACASIPSTSLTRIRPSPPAPLPAIPSLPGKPSPPEPETKPEPARPSNCKFQTAMPDQFPPAHARSSAPALLRPLATAPPASYRCLDPVQTGKTSPPTALPSVNRISRSPQRPPPRMTPFRRFETVAQAQTERLQTSIAQTRHSQSLLSEPCHCLAN